MRNRFIISLSFVCLSLFLFSQNKDKLSIVERNITFGKHSSISRKIDAIVIHSTFNNSGGDFYDLEKILDQFKRHRVGAHYLIARDGTIYRLINEKDIAYHAGKCTFPDGRSGGNSRSIGIEVMTSFEDKPTEIQIENLVLLVKDIKTRENIKFVLRHSDIASGRKTDPWNFDWNSFLEKI